MLKKTFAIAAAALVACLSFTSCESIPQTTPRQELIELLKSGVEQNKIMLGHQDATVYGHAWSYEVDRSDVKDIVGDYPAVMGWDLGDIEFGNENNLDGVPFELIRSEIIKQHNRGGVNTISWHTNNPCGGTAWDEESGVVTSILEGGANYEMFQGWLSNVAEFLSSLRTAEGELIPIIFRPWHEHDGSWFWWGDEWCTRSEYVALWDMTYKYMAARGLDNLVWCYMPIFDGEDKIPALEQFDMVGFDEYPHGGKMDVYSERFEKKMNLLKEYRTKYDKIITVSETGSETMLTDDWFTATVMPLIKEAGISYILFWRNAWDKPDHYFCSYNGHSSEADFKAFVDNEQIITAKEVSALK